MKNKLNLDFFLNDELDKGEIDDFDISSRILSLSDQLSEEIILTNINEQIEGNMPFVNRLNYITHYREKVEKLLSDSENLDIKNFVYESVERVIITVLNGLQRKYSVNIGTDLDVIDDLVNHLRDIESLYEFFFIRNYENVADIIYKNLITNKSSFVNRYKEIYDEQEEDIFVTTEKKKFKNFDDVILINFISDIIMDIKGTYESAFELFKDIVNLDIYEEHNNRIYELLIDYGNGIVFSSDSRAADKYFNLLNDSNYFISIRNEIVMKYLETIEVDETYGNA